MPTSKDPRAASLADYLRTQAAAFSLSADVNNSDTTAQAGMSLLDAAGIADAMSPDDPRLTALSEGGLFETMPHGRTRFLETDEVRALVQRPIVAAPQDGSTILAMLVRAVSDR